MLKLKGKAKVLKFEGDRRTITDGTALGVRIKMKFDGVAAKDASGFIGQMALLFDESDDPLLPEVGPQTVTRDICNVEVKIGSVVIEGADLEKIRIEPIRGRRCNISLWVSAQADGILDDLHRLLDETSFVTLTERQVELVKLEGGVAPEPQ